MNRKALSSLSILFILAISTTVFASDASTNTDIMLGFTTLIPPIIAIGLAFYTKNVILSLFIGALSGTFIICLYDDVYVNSIIGSFLLFVDIALGSLADPWNAGIILQVLAIGGVVHLISKMGGAKAVAESLVTKAKTPRSAQLITWLLGVLVFFDDYANALIVGPIMRPVYDKMKISREKLAFIVDATAAPIAGIAIISTWIGTEVGLIQTSFMDAGVDVDGFDIFLQTIPYRFYNIFMLIFVVFIALSLKDFGPMVLAQKKAMDGDLGENSNAATDEIVLKDNIVLKKRNALIPIFVLIFGSLLSFYFSGRSEILSSDDLETINTINSNPLSFYSIRACFGKADASIALFQSALFAGIVAIIMAVSQKMFSLTEAIDTWVDGMKTLLSTCVILILAWSLGSTIGILGTGDFLVSALGDKIPVFILPSIIFVLGSIISFSTGTAYGTMGILMPLAVPLAFSLNADMNYVIVCTSAVLTGAIFGDHCSPISDTTILSSMGSSCNHINHVKTQIPYALYVGIITILVGYIPAGIGVSPFIIIPVASIAMYIGLHLFGKKVQPIFD